MSYQYTSNNQRLDSNEFFAYICSLEARIENLELTLSSILQENQELKWSAQYNYESKEVEPLEDFYRSH